MVGPALGLLHPSQAFGPNLRSLSGLAVAAVVFEGGLALDFRELRAAGEGVLRLTAIALPINFVLSTLAAHLIGGMLWGPAAVFGAILAVTTTGLRTREMRIWNHQMSGFLVGLMVASRIGRHQSEPDRICHPKPRYRLLRRLQMIAATSC